MATIFRSPLTVRPPKRPSQQPDPVVNLVPLQTPAVVGDPFYQLDWPLPRRGREPQKSDAPANLLPVQNPQVAGDPFFQLDWPQAAASRRLVQVDAVGNLVPLQAAPAAGDPFFQLDWPQAARLLRPLQSDILVNRLPLTRAIAVGLPKAIRRRRYVLPNGMRFTGTDDELQEFLFRMRAPTAPGGAEAETPARADAAPEPGGDNAPPSELVARLFKGQPAVVLPELVVPGLPALPGGLDQALAALRARDEDEVIALLLLADS